MCRAFREKLNLYGFKLGNKIDWELHYILITRPFWRYECAVSIIEILDVILVDIDTGEYSSEEDHYTQLLLQRTHKLSSAQLVQLLSNLISWCFPDVQYSLF